jgi:FKBP-type peptidyl-prolyl cis-trans isomerase FkpA/FKBP-type peptidyl-prolyl cis-trans isomerase FklB
MHLIATIAMICAISSPCFAQDDAAAPELKTTKDKVSYAIGRNIGRNIKAQDLDLDPQILASAIAAVLADQPSALTDDEMTAAFAALQEEQAKKRAAMAEANKAAGAKFLAENAKKEGVKVTASGLQYKVIREGTGPSPKKSSTVTTHYRGRLLDGEIFDESYAGESPEPSEDPRSFGVSQVIPGWTEALQLMKVGGKIQVYVPGDLAYGPQGRPGIPPNSVLIFDVELLNVK